MSNASHTNITTGIAMPAAELVAMPEQGIASRVLVKTPAGNTTLFAFDAGQGLTEHTSPFDALVVVLVGAFALTVGGQRTEAAAGSICLMPGGVPHAVEAMAPSRMLLVMHRPPA
jgi:quercetin dioxygenase-like cupin family protein